MMKYIITNPYESVLPINTYLKKKTEHSFLFFMGDLILSERNITIKGNDYIEELSQDLLVTTNSKGVLTVALTPTKNNTMSVTATNVAVTPERIPLNNANAVSPVIELYSSVDKAFDFSLSGAFSGSVNLQINYGDGVWQNLASYTTAKEDYGQFSAYKIQLRCQTSTDFSGAAAFLIAQGARMFDVTPGGLI